LTSIRVFLPVVLLALVFLPVFAAGIDAEAAAEIEFLLEAVGVSGCVFIRNDKDHSSEEAEDHLRLKYRNGKRWVKSPEQFIERIATKSSWSGDPYLIRCSDAEQQSTGEWLSARLADYRDSTS
jgi:hypothetical protein